MESLAAADVGAVLQAVREACPGIPVSVSTAAWIEPDLRDRLSMLESWTLLPDFASVNLSEDGALAIVDLLNERGVGVEAGVWSVDDARILLDKGLDDACARVLVEVEAESDPDAAVRLASAIDFILDDGLSQAPRLHHGEGLATWSVLAAAIDKGHDVRVGLEDTLVLGNGRSATDNAELVAAVGAMAAVCGRAIETTRSRSARAEGRSREGHRTPALRPSWGRSANASCAYTSTCSSPTVRTSSGFGRPAAVRA
jgi:uncharacterized protein (DUF849 family)